MKTRRCLTVFALVLILGLGLYAAIFAYKKIPITYDGSKINVLDLYNNPSDYDTSNPDGIADIIVKENLEKTNAINDVASIVFDFRGFDTLGESFILLTAIAGSFVILSRHKKEEKGE